MLRPMNEFELGGLIAAPYTPLRADGDLNLELVEKLARALEADGVRGAFVCGTTGEGPSLTTDERMNVAARWAEVCRGGKLKLIVHVGHNSQRDAMALAAHAKKVGASAIAAMPPSFFKPAAVGQLADFMSPIAQAGGGLPFYYYHIPSMTGVSLSMAEFLETSAQRVPHLRGIKFTHNDLMDYQRCRRACDGKYEIAWGLDEMLLAALAVGATSAVGSTYNYAAPIYVRMIDAFRARDMETARMCASHSIDLVAILLKRGVLRTGKAIMATRGLDCGPTRLPVIPLSPQEFREVRQALEGIGFVARANSP